MGQFKPMVKMMTTEPKVELKLKKGGIATMPKMKSQDNGTGHKKMAMGGRLGKMVGEVAPPVKGAAALLGRPAVNEPAAVPKKPSIVDRMRAAKGMKMRAKGGEVESKAEHKAEMEKMAKLEGELKSHEGKPASKAHKGLKTGGVVKGQGGYKTGGVAKGQGGYKTGGVAKGQGGYAMGGKIAPARRPMPPAPVKAAPVKAPPPPVKTSPPVRISNDKPAVQIKNPTPMYGFKTLQPYFGRKTGGVIEGQGGFCEGGATKKGYATGGMVDSGKPVAMPQGRKAPSKPATQVNLSGVFKKGGKVSKKAEGGAISDIEDQLMTNKANRAFDDFKRMEKEENEAMRDAVFGVPKHIMRGLKSMLGSKAPEGSVTKTEKSVTVAPAKKAKGGSVATMAEGGSASYDEIMAWIKQLEEKAKADAEKAKSTTSTPTAATKPTPAPTPAPAPKPTPAPTPAPKPTPAPAPKSSTYAPAYKPPPVVIPAPKSSSSSSSSSSASGIRPGETPGQYQARIMGVKPVANIYPSSSNLYGNYTPRIKMKRGGKA